MNRFTLGVISLALVAASGCGRGKLGTAPLVGTESSGGIEVLDVEDGTTWFLGRDRTIRTCVEVAADFGRDARAVEADIQTAFSIWRKYLDQKRLSLKLMSVPDIATKTAPQAKCDGSEDLKFVLGGAAPGTISSASIAVAKRLSYDQNQNWGKGVVWLAKSFSNKLSPIDWNREGTFLTAMLHELGHVYGCGHVEGTIMSSVLAPLLSDIKWAAIAEVDWSRELVLPCWDCDASYEANTGPILHTSSTTPPKEYLPAVFESLIGRRPTGKVNVTVELKGTSDHKTLSGIYRISDDTGSHAVPLRGERALAATADSAWVMKRVYRTANSWGYFHQPTLQMVYLGYLEVGGKIPVTITRNMDGYALMVRNLGTTDKQLPILFAATASPKVGTLYLFP